jgi:hypothetical protein
MKDLTNEWLLLTREMNNGLPQVRNALFFPEHNLCLSIQASEFHYCLPKNNDGPYNAVEVGVAFEDEFPPELMEYRQRWDDNFVTNTTMNVCGYVPVAVVNALLNRLGVEFIPRTGVFTDKGISYH